MKKNTIKNIALVLVLCMALSMFTGCGAEEEPIRFEKYTCNSELSSSTFTPEDFFLVADGFGDRYHGYQMPTIQVDDNVINLGVTTLGEVYEMFMDVTVEEQIRTAKADDEGIIDRTPEEMEQIKKEEREKAEKQKEKEEEKNEADETTAPEEKEPAYSFYISFDDGNARTYAPIYLISSDLVTKGVVFIYKHGLPYVQLTMSNLYAENMGIHQESDLVITGVGVSTVKDMKYADENGLNKAAKSNVWINGGYSLSGDNFEYTTLPNVFTIWNLQKGDGYLYDSEYFTRTEDESFYYYADLYCREPVYYNNNLYLNKAVFKYTINRDTQKITALSIELERINWYDADTYEVTDEKPTKVYGEDF